MGAKYPLSQRAINKLTRGALVDQWGREIDKSTYFGVGHSNGNPDDTTENEKWNHANQPIVKAGKQYRNISYLWVTAAGLNKEQHGTDFPPQLAYVNPEYSDQEIFDHVAYQLDEAFDVRFGQIFKKFNEDSMDNGRAIAEIDWFVKDSGPFKKGLFASFIHSRDPEPYIFDPKDHPPGLYKDVGFGKLERMEDNRFIYFTYSGEFDNPYGRSINFPLRPEKAGLGAWVALYDESMGGEDSHSKKMRNLLFEQVKQIAAGTASIMSKGTELTNHKLQMDAEAFLSWHKTYSEQTSLVYTGSATALLNEENGSRAAKESTDVREKSQLEMDDAQRIGGDWTQKFIRRVVGLNFPPDRPKALPQIYIINPATIMPTTPADQLTVEEAVEEPEAGNEEQEPEPTEDENQELSAFGSVWEGQGGNIHTEKNPPEIVSNIKGKAWKRNDAQNKKIQARILNKWADVGEEITVGSYVGTGEPMLKNFGPVELQEEEEPKPPVAVPAGNEEFPRKTPTPEQYLTNADAAKAYLSDMPVKNWRDFQPDDGGKVFTIKRQRFFTPSTELLEELKQAIVPTLDAPDEEQAWLMYYESAKSIFKEAGLDMTPSIRSDLNISFRQARQTSYSRGLIAFGQQDGAIGMGTRTLKDGHAIRFEHDKWDGVALVWDHPRFDEVINPADFGCVCENYLVYSLGEITQDSQIPTIKRGKSYELYAF
jgi:hypothetical protein